MNIGDFEIKLNDRMMNDSEKVIGILTDCAARHVLAMDCKDEFLKEIEDSEKFDNFYERFLIGISEGED